MKKELLRFQDVCFEIRGQKYGPFFFQLFEGELTGILTDDFFDKELLVELFCGKCTLLSGFLYLREELVSPEEQMKILKKISSEWIAVISGRSRLFEALSISENIFFPLFLFRTNKLNKITRELFHFFQLDFSPNKRIDRLSTLERIQIELLHALVCKRKVIIVSDVNKSLRKKEVFCLNRMYQQLVQMGYHICLVESLTDVTMEMLHYFSLIKSGKTVGSGYKGEYSYREAYLLLNMSDRTEEYQKLLKKKEKKYYVNQDVMVLEWENVTGINFHKLSFALGKGEIMEIICRRHSSYIELTNVLRGNQAPVSGAVCLEGNPISSGEVRAALKKWEIGCVDTSSSMLFENKTVIENICYPLSLKNRFFYLRRKYAKAAREYILDIAKEIDMRAKVKDLLPEQVTWVSLSKWILCKPQLLLFFVPAATRMDNLDIVTEKLLVELGIHGVAILLVTEEQEIASEIIDQEIII